MSEPEAQRGGRARLGRILRILFTAVLLTLLVRHVEWRRVLEVLAHLRPGPVALALVTFVAAQILSAAKWRWIAVYLRCGASLAQHARLYFAGMFLSLFLPGFVGGDLFRASSLAGAAHRWLPTGPTFWSVLLERLTGLWGLAVLLAAGLFATGHALDGTGWLAWASGVGVVAMIAAAVAMDRSVRRGSVARRLETLGARPGNVAPVIRVFAASIAVQLLYALVHFLLAVALGMGLRPSHWLWIAPAVGFVASLPVSLGGLGAREWGYIVALELVGRDRAEAAAFASLWLMLVTAVSLAGGGALLAGDRRGLLARFH